MLSKPQWYIDWLFLPLSTIASHCLNVEVFCTVKRQDKFYLNPNMISIRLLYVPYRAISIAYRHADMLQFKIWQQFLAGQPSYLLKPIHLVLDELELKHIVWHTLFILYIFVAGQACRSFSTHNKTR